MNWKSPKLSVLGGVNDITSSKQPGLSESAFDEDGNEVENALSLQA